MNVKINVLPDENKILRGFYARWLSALSFPATSWFAPEEDYFRVLAYALGDRHCSKYVASLAELAAQKLGREDAVKLHKCAGGCVHENLAALLSEHDGLRDLAAEYTGRLLREELARVDKRAEKNFFKALTSLFCLDGVSLKLCEFLFSANATGEARGLFLDYLSLSERSARETLAALLGVSPAVLSRSEASLLESGLLVEKNHKYFLDPAIEYALKYNPERLRAQFCARLPKTRLTMDSFKIPAAEKEHVLMALAASAEYPTHILLYGAPGTGKTSFAACLIKTLKLKGWAVNAPERERDGDRRVALAACLRMAERKPGSVILVDEADKLLDTDWTSGCVSKAWLNPLLERKGVKAVWICNDITHIDESVRRRFSFGVRFADFGEKWRREIWDDVTKRLGARSRLPESARERFARLYDLPPSAVEMAVRQAKNLEKERDISGRVEIILNSQIAMKGARKNLAPVRRDENFDPRLLNISERPDKLLKKLRRLQNLPDEPGAGNLLFYGPPGTGKTGFARHLARELEMDVLIKRPCDILGSLVGEIEKNVAAAFGEATARGALLLVDEADSFLFDRSLARASWERSMVNEFLTWLENFGGICVFATNAREITDEAAVRRFAFKIEFGYPSAAQRVGLYEKILKPLAPGNPSDANVKILRSLAGVAPADFRNVRKRFLLEETPSHDELVAALREEARLRKNANSLKMGF